MERDWERTAPASPSLAAAISLLSGYALSGAANALDTLGALFQHAAHRLYLGANWLMLRRSRILKVNKEFPNGE